MVNRTIDKVLDFTETYVCGIIFAAMATIIMLQIILRTTGLPLAWTEETARYLFVWIIYISASKAVKKGKHLSVDLLSIALKGKGKQMIAIMVNLISLIFFLVLCFYGFKVINKLSLHPQYSAAVGYNMVFPYSAPFVGSILMILRAAQNIVQNIKDFHTPDTEEVTPS